MNPLRAIGEMSPFHPRLRRRIALTLSLAGLLAAAVASVASFYQIYRDEMTLVEQSLENAEETLVISLEQALWELDPAQTDLVLDSLMKLPGADGLVVKTDDGPLHSRGELNAPAWLVRQYNLYFGDDRQYPLGTLTIRIGKSHLYEHLRARGVALTITVLVTIGVMSIVVMLTMRRWIFRHLETMAGYASALTGARLDMPLVLADKRRAFQPDELDALGDAINQMREQLAMELQIRAQHEAELERRRDELEARVAERTAELQAANSSLAMKRAILQEMVDVDGLTGAASRHATLLMAESALRFAEQNDNAVCVLMLDADHFKRVNDTHSHAAGDIVLRTIAERCRSVLRAGDLLGRMGGEEFVAILPATELETAMRIAERLRAAIADTPIEIAPEIAVDSSVSIGVVRALAHESVNSLIGRADRAMYTAKHEGRNRVCAAPTPGAVSG